jgi:putative ABC transport system permease protein
MDVDPIPLTRLAWAIVPMVGVWLVLQRWKMHSGHAVYAALRMVGQLLLVGYVLTTLFDSSHPWFVLLALLVMLSAASWIAVGSDIASRSARLPRALVAIGVFPTATLLLVTQVVLQVDPWYDPRTIISLGGMIYANSMNCVSLASERLTSELSGGGAVSSARAAALNAALLPVTNSLLAVGLVSLPGMMTGQILSGVPPLVTVRYQIMVMAMVYGSGGLAAASFLALEAPSGREKS